MVTIDHNTLGPHLNLADPFAVPSAGIRTFAIVGAIEFGCSYDAVEREQHVHPSVGGEPSFDSGGSIARFFYRLYCSKHSRGAAS